MNVHMNVCLCICVCVCVCVSTASGFGIVIFRSLWPSCMKSLREFNRKRNAYHQFLIKSQIMTHILAAAVAIIFYVWQVQGTKAAPPQPR